MLTKSNIIGPMHLLLLSFLIVPSGFCQAQEKPDLSNKVVLANLDRYEAILQFGKSQKRIAPKKATVVSPKKYPIEIEYWTGNKTTGWQKKKITKAGIYGMNFKNKQWIITELKKGGKNPTVSNPKTPTPKQGHRRIARRPSRSSAINADRRFWHPLARVAWAAGSIYKFIRDEDDRNLFRHLLLEGREEDIKAFEKWIEDSELADHYKDTIRDAYSELSNLNERDWKEIEKATDEDWDRAREDLGSLVDDNAWKEFSTDFDDIDTNDFWEEGEDLDINDLEDVGIEENLDLEVEDLDIGDTLDVGDLGIDSENYDFGDYDDYGDYGDNDFGDNDFGDDFGGDDFGGGFDDFGGDDF